MEEYEKRRERLRAMRTDSQNHPSPSPSPSPTNLPSPSPSLSNPLLEPSEPSPSSVQPQRFGFYTDPMAAFSSDHRRPHFTPPPPPSTGPHNLERPISGVNQFQNTRPPYHSMHQGGAPYYRPDQSPIGVRNPYPVHQGSSTPGRGHWSNNNFSPIHSPGPGPGPGSAQGGSPFPMHQGSPRFGPAPGRGQWSNNFPGPSPGPGSAHGGSPFPMHQGSPDFRPPPQGRGHWFNHSPNQGAGRGGGHNPGIGRGRGQSEWGRASPSPRYSGGGSNGARSFYSKSMVEDPWESLTPVIWTGSDSSQIFSKYHGSFQKSPMAKKPRISDSSGASNSKQSLAEFLAASFDEAGGDETAG